MIRTYYISLDHPQRGKGYYTMEAGSLSEAQEIARERFSGKVPRLKVHPYREEIPEDYRTQFGSLGTKTNEARYFR